MIAVIITNLPTKKKALSMGKALLEAELIVCNNIKKIDSQYIWKGKYHEETEYQMSVKTTLDKKKQVVKYIKQNHPYDIPYLSTSEVGINNAYNTWMDDFLS